MNVEEAIADLTERVEELEEENDELSERVSTLEEEKDELSERVDTLENNLEKAREQRKRLLADTYDVDERLSEVEKRFAMDPERPADGETGAETSLEVVAAWPDAAAEDELSTNAEHARAVALTLSEFVDKTPRGLKLGSSDVRKALTARTGEAPHSETVYRTMDFLESFGETLVREDVVRNGERRLYWVEEAPTRLTAASQGDVMESREQSPEET